MKGDSDELYPEHCNSWEKIVDASKKAGFREGASIAREENYQQFFDIGYKEGFKNAFELGKLKAQIRSTNTDPCLSNTRKGACILCTSQNFTQRISDIAQDQTTHINNLIKNSNKT